jgi:CBS domain-containing protein/anti-sigma regulatory factor (Ser/Thr protein kinase)
MDKIDEILKRIQNYFKEVKVKEFMSSPVITIHEDRKISCAKEMLRRKRFSGMPVIDDEKRLVGIISVEDIIRAMENKKLNLKVSEEMSKNVVTLNKENKITDVVRNFEVYGFGRFPIVDEGKHVIGIVTKHDLMTALLSKLSILYVHDVRREPFVNTENFRSALTGINIENEMAEFKFRVDYKDVSMAGTGASKLKKFLLSKGFPPKFVKRVAVATYEAEANVVIHADAFGIIKAYVEPYYVTVRVEDNGKGIEDVKMAMQEGFSTAPDHVREIGFGAGMGLPNMKKCSDKLMILSEPKKGVIVEMNFWRREDENI